MHSPLSCRRIKTFAPNVATGVEAIARFSRHLLMDRYFSHTFEAVAESGLSKYRKLNKRIGGVEDFTGVTND